MYTMTYTLLARFLFCKTRPKERNLIFQFKGFLSLRGIRVLHYTVQGQYYVALYGEFIFYNTSKHRLFVRKSMLSRVLADFCTHGFLAQ
jgi:hypothetical protein